MIAQLQKSVAGLKKSQQTRRANGRRRAGAIPAKTPSANRSMTRAMPAAYAAHVRPRFNVSSRTATSAVVSGCDLIYPIPATLAASSDTVFAMFPANPAYWMGTRISQFAPAYQNYRPLAFRVSYIPQVAVTQQGTVFMGTLWNEAAPTDNIQQSLFTSNGGCLTQCYVPCDTTVKLGRNLQQNLFTMNESLNPDTCPFMFLAGVRGADVVPGYFYVSYTYEFRNPIGSAWAFNTSGLTTVGALPTLPTYANMTFVLAEQAGGFGPGTQLDLEVNGRVYYHGSEIELDNSVAGVLYSNQQSAITTNTLANYFNVVAGKVGTSSISFSSFIKSTGTSVTVGAGASLMVVASQDAGTSFSLYYNGGAESITVSPSAGSIYYVWTTGSRIASISTTSGSVFDFSDASSTADAGGNYIQLPPEYKVAELN